MKNIKWWTCKEVSGLKKVSTEIVTRTTAGPSDPRDVWSMEEVEEVEEGLLSEILYDNTLPYIVKTIFSCLLSVDSYI